LPVVVPGWFNGISSVADSLALHKAERPSRNCQAGRMEGLKINRRFCEVTLHLISGHIINWGDRARCGISSFDSQAVTNTLTKSHNSNFTDVDGGMQRHRKLGYSERIFLMLRKGTFKDLSSDSSKW
jgi:hypothetical protein